MTSRVADEIQQEIPAVAAGDDRTRQQLQVRQATLRMISLQCYGGSWELEPADVAHMAQLMVLINHGQLFFEDAYFQDPKQERQQLADMRTRCHNVMATRCMDIMKVLNFRRAAAVIAAEQGRDNSIHCQPANQSCCLLSHVFQAAGSAWHDLLVSLPCLQVASSRPQQVLTAAAKCVVHRTPGHLAWSQLRQEHHLLASFGGIATDGSLYSINLLDGAVLLDGLPPSRLLKEITQHAMFRYDERQS
jgi:hypothetical protein